MTSRLAVARADLKSHYEVVVVGSGYGGSIAASRVARRGRSVCLFERGAERIPGEYPNTVVEVSKEIQFDAPALRAGSRTALFDLRYNDDINVVIGCGLGGTSLINAGMCLRPDPAVFQSPAWPAALRKERVLDPYFGAAEAMLRPAPAPQSALRSPKTRAFEAAATSLATAEPVPILVNFEPLEGGVNHVGVAQNPCVFCGDCVSGCNYAAKSTLIMNYLPDARAHGAEIFVEALVRRLERSGDLWRVHGVWIEHGELGAHFEVEAETVVLSAGSLGSTEVLLRSAQTGLVLSARVGARFSGNGDMIGFAYNTEQTIDGVGLGARPAGAEAIPGPCSTAMIDLRKAGAPTASMVVEDGAIPGALAPLLAPFFTLEGKLFGDSAGEPFADVVRKAARETESDALGAYAGAIKNTLFFLLMAHDDSRGRLYLEDDRIRATCPGLGTDPQFQAASDVLDRLSHALAGTYVKNPIWNALTRHNVVTGHPLGGCAMADQAEDGVVNDRGQVFSANAGTATHPGLYVMDGSIVPTSLGINPLMTISALAERCCELMVDGAPA